MAIATQERLEVAAGSIKARAAQGILDIARQIAYSHTGKVYVTDPALSHELNNYGCL